MTVTDPTPDSLFIRIAEWVASTIGGLIFGFLAAVVTFRTSMKMTDRRLAEHDAAIEKQNQAIKQASEAAQRDIDDHRESIALEAMRAERAFRESLDAMRAESEKRHAESRRLNDERHEENRSQLRLVRRQQFLQLKMMADMARHSGADKRFDDQIWRALDDGQREDGE